ncbi:MAG TPA: thrombospondin type 3 repeat-containing protein [Kofleriaceae bacterium]|jgi:hypothetical protein
MLFRGPLLALLLGASGCGRLSFDPTGGIGNDALPGGDASDGPTGHDEDGDGVPDSVDTCPHLPGAQTDTDGDGIGDLCDAHPAMNIDSRVVFATLTDTDQPFEIGSGDWAVDGDDLAQTLTYADLALTLPTTTQSIQITVGVTIDSIVAGPMEQRQLTVHGTQVLAEEQFYGELNEVPPSLSAMEIEHYTPPSTYSPADMANLATGIHTGDATLRLTKDLTAHTIEFRGGWGSEIYKAAASDPLYAGTRVIYINMNGIAVHLHYIFATTWTP